MWFSISVYSPEKEYFVAIFDVITERKQAEAALQSSEALLRDAQRITHVGSWSRSLTDNIVRWSDEMYRIYGVIKEEFPLTPESFVKLLHPDDRPLMAKWVEQAIAQLKPETLDFRVVRPDGTVRHIRGEGGLITDQAGNPECLTGTAQDITERKQAEEEIVRKGEQLRALAARLAEVEEAERQHLARVLHDQVCQGLTALGLTLTLLQTQMPRKAAPALLGRLADALALLEQTGETIRNLMGELRPPMLDDYGLLSTLHWYGAKFSDKTGIGVDVQGREASTRLGAPGGTGPVPHRAGSHGQCGPARPGHGGGPDRGGGQRHGSPGHRRQRRRLRPGAAGPARGAPRVGAHDHGRAGRGGWRPLPH